MWKITSHHDTLFNPSQRLPYTLKDTKLVYGLALRNYLIPEIFLILNWGGINMISDTLRRNLTPTLELYSLRHVYMNFSSNKPKNYMEYDWILKTQLFATLIIPYIEAYFIENYFFKLYSKGNTGEKKSHCSSLHWKYIEIYVDLKLTTGH